jgi:hypothetical protein
MVGLRGDRASVGEYPIGESGMPEGFTFLLAAMLVLAVAAIVVSAFVAYAALLRILRERRRRRP